MFGERVHSLVSKRKIAAGMLAVLLVAGALFVMAPQAKAVPIAVEIRCGYAITPAGTNVTWTNGTDIPTGNLLQFWDVATATVIATASMGDGMAPNPGEGRFDVTLSLDTDDLPMSIYIRAYDSPNPATATAYGDSATFAVAGVGPYDIAGWMLGVLQTPTGGGDVSSSSSSGNITLNNFGAPSINDYDMRLASSPNTSVMNQQVDVGLEYFFQVNVTDLKGHGNLRSITVTAWYDDGNDSSVYGGGFPNTQFALQYSYVSNPGNTVQLLSTYTVAEPEIVISQPAQEIFSDANTSTMRLYFALGIQIRHAPGPGSWNPATNGGATPVDGFNDLNSWNFQINVTNADDFSISAYDEFAVYRYTAVHSPNLDVSATGIPGQTVAFPGLPVNFSSNDQYHFYVYVNNTLTRINPITPPDSIDVSNIRAAGGELPSTAFTGTGPANPLYIYYNHPAPNNGTWQETTVYFYVSIPLNTLSGYYQGDIVYTIEQF